MRAVLSAGSRAPAVPFPVSFPPPLPAAAAAGCTPQQPHGWFPGAPSRTEGLLVRPPPSPVHTDDNIVIKRIYNIKTKKEHSESGRSEQHATYRHGIEERDATKQMPRRDRHYRERGGEHAVQRKKR